MSKKAKVLKYIQTHKKGITSMQAIDMFKATRLSAIIFELRKKYIILTIDEQGITEEGYPYTYARYVYQGENWGEK
jgi:DNA-binding GntR family transcriptional regulator